jgi:hypothetical protein
MTQARRVETGISGSSVFATAERTSGYGESSSSEKKYESYKMTSVRPKRTEDVRGGFLVEIGVVEVIDGENRIGFYYGEVRISFFKRGG